MTEPLSATIVADDVVGRQLATDDDAVDAMTGARWFVTLVFCLIGISFVAMTALVVWEFRAVDWLSIVLLHSHLFVFFPTLGLVALAAFRLPATVFTHLYWTHIPYGRLRYTIGAGLVMLAAVGFSVLLDTSNADEVWQLSPAALVADRAEPSGCEPGRQSCRRVALMDAVTALRDASKSRIGVSKFARPCKADPLLEVPDEFARVRYCFASGSMVSGAACCIAQTQVKLHLNRLMADPTNRSLSDRFNLIAQPLKVFFVIVVVVIGLLLVIWRRLLEQKYAPIAPAIERALLIGALAMLPWPFMDYAYQQAVETLTGRESATPELRLSLVIGPWALLLLVFFLARMGRKIERLGQLAGACASLVALLRYNELNDLSVRLLGMGAPLWMMGVLIAFAVMCLMSLRFPKHLQRAINGAIGRHPDVGASAATVARLGPQK